MFLRIQLPSTAVLDPTKNTTPVHRSAVTTAVRLQLRAAVFLLGESVLCWNASQRAGVSRVIGEIMEYAYHLLNVVSFLSKPIYFNRDNNGSCIL